MLFFLLLVHFKSRNDTNKIISLILCDLLGLMCTIFALNDFKTSNIKQHFRNRNIRLFFQYVDFVCLVLVYNCRAAVDEVIFIKDLKKFLSDR